MDKFYIKEILLALRAELIRFRLLSVALFIAVSFAVLALGYIWPKKYTTSAVLFADVTNIIESLLKENTELTKVDRSEQASEIIYTRSSLVATARMAGLLSGELGDLQQDRLVRQLRAGISIKRERNNNYFQVSYTASNPDTSFEVLNAIINVFIESTARKKREESLGAYNFIDTQVQTYKRQLEMAEEKLKDFKAKNTDGTEETVNARITSLREDVEALKIAIDESQSRLKTIQQQLSNEGRYLQTKGQLDELRVRRQNLNGQLEQLLLSYQENYPDVVSLRGQLDELDAAIERLKSSGEVYSNQRVENPLYEELRKQLAETDVTMRSQKRRMQSLQDLQAQEFERQQRIASNQAQLSELTRDYDVTRKVYEEMLQRKEAARMSMNLDIEGQGINYKIQEPAGFPLKPSGLNYIHFAILGPLLGLFFPLGLLVLYVLLDPHLRSGKLLQKNLPDDIELIAIVPHYNSPLGERLLRKDMLIVFGVGVFALAAYFSLAIFGYTLNR